MLFVLSAGAQPFTGTMGCVAGLVTIVCVNELLYVNMCCFTME